MCDCTCKNDLQIDELIERVIRTERKALEALKDYPTPKTDDPINPDHYNGKDCLNKMINEFGLEAVYWFCVCNQFKYDYRAGNKPGNSRQQDLQKAAWYEAEADRIKSELYSLVEGNDTNFIESWLQNLPRKIVIAGDTWTISINDKVLEAGNFGGLTDGYKKKIILSSYDRLRKLSDEDPETICQCFRHILLHELYHAHFFSFGLDCYSSDETLIDHLALKKKYFDSILGELGFGYEEQ